MGKCFSKQADQTVNAIITQVLALFIGLSANAWSIFRGVVSLPVGEVQAGRGRDGTPRRREP